MGLPEASSLPRPLRGCLNIIGGLTLASAACCCGGCMGLIKSFFGEDEASPVVEQAESTQPLPPAPKINIESGGGIVEVKYTKGNSEIPALTVRFGVDMVDVIGIFPVEDRTARAEVEFWPNPEEGGGPSFRVSERGISPKVYSLNLGGASGKLLQEETETYRRSRVASTYGGTCRVTEKEADLSSIQIACGEDGLPPSMTGEVFPASQTVDIVVHHMLQGPGSFADLNIRIAGDLQPTGAPALIVSTHPDESNPSRYAAFQVEGLGGILQKDSSERLAAAPQ